MISGVRGKTLRLAAAGLLALSGLGAGPAPPQFESLSRDKVFLREGPSYQHRILWIYHRRDLPVQVIGSYDIWRRIRDSDGTTGWVHGSMVSDRRTIVVTSRHPAAIRDDKGRPVAFAQDGVVARLEACEAQQCKISADGTEGWIKKTDIWGVSTGEVFK